MKKVLIFIKKILQNTMFLFLFCMGIDSFTFKGPYFIILGVMLILLSFLFFTYLDNILSHFKIKLTKWQKTFIGVVNFLIATYSVNYTEINYFKCILPIIMMIVVFLLTIIYSNRKSKTNN